MSHDLASPVDEFRRALVACRQLYLSSGSQIVEQFPHLLPAGAGEFRETMDDLHRGLLVKLFVTVSEADGRWSAAEQRLASVLLEHLWRQSLAGERLQTALTELSRQADRLQWYSLIRPFDVVAPLRDRIGELETIVLRIANLAAKADGAVLPAAAERLRHIQNQLHDHLHRLPLDAPGHHEEADLLGAQALRQAQQPGERMLPPIRIESGKSQPEPASDPRAREERLAEALAELDAMIGLDGVKERVRTLANFLNIQRVREEQGLPRTPVSLHMVFCGNPGTGKTTVARTVGRVFGAMGVLEKGHLVETDRSGLVASYAGQTATKTNKKIDEALDGVLFIDEAYSLVAERSDDAYGHEALQALLKRMEDDRRRLVVILAGYPAPMERLLRSNPGLSSRFNTRLSFDDYTPAELGRIFAALCGANQYVIPWQTKAKLILALSWLHERRDEHFGNGRLVRNGFEEAIRRLANRIAGIAPLTTELLTTLEPDDVLFEGVPSESLAVVNDPEFRLAVSCPSCNHESRAPASFLGQRVKCSRCDHRFVPAWDARP